MALSLTSVCIGESHWLGIKCSLQPSRPGVRQEEKQQPLLSKSNAFSILLSYSSPSHPSGLLAVSRCERSDTWEKKFIFWGLWYFKNLGTKAKRVLSNVVVLFVCFCFNSLMNKYSLALLSVVSYFLSVTFAYCL